jgi:murein DD-endopeptidase MepM/ murein hydrolase activator NlpD
MKKVGLIILLICVSIFCFSLDFGNPVNDSYVVSSPFGFRESVMGGMEDGFHHGIDIVPDEIIKNKKANVKVLATEDGVVSTVYPPPGTIGWVYGKKIIFKGHPIFGGLVVIDHGEGIYSLYGHLKSVYITEGTKIKKGQAIGLVGSTGQSTGPHLHFEIGFDPFVLLYNSQPLVSSKKKPVIENNIK